MLIRLFLGRVIINDFFSSLGYFYFNSADLLLCPCLRQQKYLRLYYHLVCGTNFNFKRSFLLLSVIQGNYTECVLNFGKSFFVGLFFHHFK